MVMRMVSLGFDLDPGTTNDGKKRTPNILSLPTFLEYMGYCLFPTTSIFGPFIIFNDHVKFLDQSPLVKSCSYIQVHYSIIIWGCP